MSNAPQRASTSGSGDRETYLALSEDDLADAKRLLAKIVGQTETVVRDDGVFADSKGRGHLIGRAEAVLASRKRRAKIFRRGMFGEPAWEMLLALYVSHDGQRESIGSLRDVAGITLTTALRWLDFLEGEKLVRRLEHRFDKRRVSIELTDRAREMLDLYFSGTP